MTSKIRLIDGSSEILDYFDNMKYGVIFYVGSGKTFKTGTMFSVWEHPQSKKTRARLKAFYDPPIRAESFMPKHQNATSIYDLFKAPPGCILSIDDMPVTLQSRGSGLAKKPQQIQGIISQKGIRIDATLQTFASGDIAFLRDQGSESVHKWMHPNAIKFERPEFKNECMTANRKIYEVHRALRDKGIRIDPLYISWVPGFNRALILPPPPWYNEDIAHYRKDWIPGEVEA